MLKIKSALVWKYKLTQGTFELSNESEVLPEVFNYKQLAWIIDQNNGSYSSAQVQLDTSSFSNSGKPFAAV